MKTNFELVKEFHAAFNKTPDPEVPTEQSDKIRILRHRLIEEEFNEVTQELQMKSRTTLWDDFKYIDIKNHLIFDKGFDINRLAKELSDLLYVVYGTAAAYGIPIDDVYRKVHENNMSKLQSDGTVKYREDGKVLKPDTYVPLDVSKLLER